MIAADEPHAVSQRPSRSTSLCSRWMSAQPLPVTAGSVVSLLQQSGPEVLLRVQLAALKRLTIKVAHIGLMPSLTCTRS